MIQTRLRTPIAVLLCAAVLVGCDAVGDGVNLDRIEVTADRLAGSEATGDERALLFECFVQRLRVSAFFTNGRVSDFSGRANYSSDNEAVVRASNADVPDATNANFVYRAGVLVPVAPGEATVTVEFAGLTETMDVEVRGLPGGALTLTKPAAEDGSDLTRFAPGSIVQYSLRADLDGDDTNVSGDVVWEFTQPDTSVATVNDIGTVTAVAPGEELELAPRLAVCAGSAAAQNAPTAPVDVDEVTDVVVGKEFDDRNTLIVGTSEVFSARADFGDGGPTQVITDLVTFSVPDSDDPVGVISGSRLIATAEGSTEVSASYDRQVTDAQPDPVVSSAPVTINALDGTLTALDVTPQTAEIPALGSQPFDATGTFDTSGGAISQSIKRHVTWQSSDSSVVISGLGTAPGVAFSLQQRTDPLDVTITASAFGANETIISDTAALTVRAAECSDGIDNDGDGLTDFDPDGVGDPECDFAEDNSES